MTLRKIINIFNPILVIICTLFSALFLYNKNANADYRVVEYNIPDLSIHLSDSFYLQSVPVYDMDGNVYLVRSAYLRMPTREDSVEFERMSQIEIKRMIDSVEGEKKAKMSKKPAAPKKSVTPKKPATPHKL